MLAAMDFPQRILAGKTVFPDNGQFHSLKIFPAGDVNVEQLSQLFP